MTFSAVFGFKYPDQCTLLWIIAGGIVFMVIAGWGVKCYLRGERNTASVQPSVGTIVADKKEEPTDHKEDMLPAEKTELLAFVF